MKCVFLFSQIWPIEIIIVEKRKKYQLFSRQVKGKIFFVLTFTYTEDISWRIQFDFVNCLSRLNKSNFSNIFVRNKRKFVYEKLIFFLDEL